MKMATGVMRTDEMAPGGTEQNESRKWPVIEPGEPQHVMSDGKRGDSTGD